MQNFHFIDWGVPYLQEGESDLIVFQNKRFPKSHTKLIFKKKMQTANKNSKLILKVRMKWDLFSQKERH